MCKWRVVMIDCLCHVVAVRVTLISLPLVCSLQVTSSARHFFRLCKDAIHNLLNFILFLANIVDLFRCARLLGAASVHTVRVILSFQFLL